MGFFPDRQVPVQAQNFYEILTDPWFIVVAAIAGALAGYLMFKSWATEEPSSSKKGE